MRPHQMLRRIWNMTEPRLPVHSRCRVSFQVQRTCHTQALIDTKRSSNANSKPPADKYELFVHPKVQSLLRKLTELNPHKTLPDYTSLKKSREITLYTEEQLEAAKKEAEKHAQGMMQMPPVLPEREECRQVMSEDPGIAGYHKNTFVFVDTTVGLPERERNIVVRTPDGTLSSASWEIRDRMTQMFYPRSGRRIKPASLFHGDNLKRLINEQKYRYLLDIACCQFEPDHPYYINITQQVYEHCDVNESYDILQSTRHYGSMVFTFVLHKQIVNIMKYLIRKRKLLECIHIANIYSIVWDVQQVQPVTNNSSSSEQVAYIQAFLADEKLLDSDLSHELDVLLKKTAFEETKHTKIESSSEGDDEEDSNSSDSDSGSSSDSDGYSSSDDDKKS